MNSNIVFLDSSPSLLNEEINEHFVENIKLLIRTFLLMKKVRPNIQVNLDTNFFDIKISNETVIRDIPNDLKHQVIEEFRILKFNLQKSPYSIDNEDKFNQYFGIDVRYLDISYNSLIWTYLIDSMVISFDKKKLDWNSDYIQAEITNINEENEINELVQLRHVCNESHVSSHINWLSEFEEIPDIDVFLNKTNDFFSQIILLDEAIDNLKNLQNHYPAIYKTLSKVNNDLLKWDENTPLNLSKKSAQGEHKKRKQILKDLGYEGYEAHISFTGNIAGRIHYKIIKNFMEIKYIGKKIGI